MCKYRYKPAEKKKPFQIVQFALEQFNNEGFNEYL